MLSWGYNHFIFFKKGMSFINLRQLSQLVNSSKVERGYEGTADQFLKKYGMKLQHEDLQNLIQTASRINKREKTKENRNKNGLNESDYQIFVFGQLKVFNWVLVLYSHIHSLDLNNYSQSHIIKIQSIFKKKSKIFIEYQIKDIIHTKQKNSKEWENEQIDMFKQIMSSKQNQSEWKSISYELYCRSNGKYFKSFSMCREKWISHLNPNIKKTDWTLEEDVELFVMIKNYGCRWALISRQLKGIRSEHSVKNRYNVLVKTIKRQYRLGDTHQLNEKILKYLKMKLQKQKQTESQLNMSDYSLDSKCSRQRSREEEKLRLNDSHDSSEEVKNQEQFNVFDEIYHLSPQNTEYYSESCKFNVQELALKDYYNKQTKEEKKTNDHDDEEQLQKHEDRLPQSQKDFLQFQENESSDVRTNTIEELQRQYNRLLNFSDNSQSNGFMLQDDFDGGNNFLNQGNNWLFDKEEKGMSWCQLQ